MAVRTGENINFICHVGTPSKRVQQWLSLLCLHGDVYRSSQSVAIRHKFWGEFLIFHFHLHYVLETLMSLFSEVMVLTGKIKRDYQCKGPNVRCMLITRPSLFRLLFLPQEHIPGSVQVKPFSLNKTFVFNLLAMPTVWLNKTHQNEPDSSVKFLRKTPILLAYSWRAQVPEMLLESHFCQ